MLSSVHQHPQFHPIDAKTTNATIKPKKRRKRRKKPQNLMGTSGCIKAATTAACAATSNTQATKTQQIIQQHKTIAKTKQYFQHDNRSSNHAHTVGGQKQQTIHTSTIFTTSTKYTTESEMLYAQVAKKFKPLKLTTKQQTIKQKQKSATALSRLLKQQQRQQQLSLRKLKVAAQNYKGLSASLTAQKCKSGAVSNHPPTQKRQKPAALMQQQHRPTHCLCSCQNHNKCQRLTTETAVMAHQDITSSLSNSTTTSTTTSQNNMTCNNNYLTSLNFNETTLPKLLGILQNSAPSLLLETLINNAQMLESRKVQR